MALPLLPPCNMSMKASGIFSNLSIDHWII
jgi:hypothetical protein